MNEVIQGLTSKHMIIHKKSSTYHTKCKGQVESTNKTLVEVLKTKVEANKKDWDQKLDSVLRAF